jgi:hypothetical protein
MMLARFGAAGLLTDQQSTCCLSAVTPQRAIINIAVQAVCYTNELAAGYKIHVIHSFDDAGKICLLQDCSRIRLSAKPQRAIINIACRQCVTQMNSSRGTKFMIHSLMMLADLVLQVITDQQSA